MSVFVRLLGRPWIDAGDHVGARGCAGQALAQVLPNDTSPDTARILADLRIRSAEVAVAMKEWGVAARDLDRTLEVAIAERSRLRSRVARHPATSFAVRRRVAGDDGAAPDAAPVPGPVAEALWREVRREAEAVRVALGVYVVDAGERVRSSPHGPHVN